MTSARRWWLIYAACTVLVAGALVGMSGLVLGLERSERRAQADAEFQESLRLAMWRMESWLAPYLAREAARQHDDYLPYVPQPLALKRDASGLLPAEVLVPSPLLTFRSDLFPLHFQLHHVSGLSSPQVPRDGFGGLAGDGFSDAILLTVRREHLLRLRPLLELDSLLERVSGAEAIETRPAVVDDASLLRVDTDDPQLAQRRKTEAEYQARVSCAVDTTSPEAAAGGGAAPARAGSTTAVGPLVPLWLDGGGAGEKHVLVLLRRVTTGGSDALQGALVEWNVMRDRLLEQIRDLFPGARLEPVTEWRAAEADPGRDMAMLPVRLVSVERPSASVPILTTTRATLALGWLAMSVALATVGVTLHRSIEFGERRERFVSAVTHEMRTPLTTFRMYAGMLADDMVVDESKKKTYLQTLRTESTRLAAMVENVLAFARLERGRPGPRSSVRLSASELLARVAPDLERRAEEAGMTLVADVESAADGHVGVEVEPVVHIIGNLVDNACKYASDADDKTIHLDASIDGSSLLLRVRDHGPGIPLHRRRAVFEPFNRGDREPSDGTPGVGLGLAIARDLARDLGGDLLLEASGDAGASFVVRLPARASA